MKLKKINRDITLVDYQGYDSKEAIFAVETPVAVRWIGSGYFYVSEDYKNWSNRFNKLLKEWEAKDGCLGRKEVEQEWINDHT